VLLDVSGLVPYSINPLLLTSTERLLTHYWVFSLFLSLPPHLALVFLILSGIRLSHTLHVSPIILSTATTQHPQHTVAYLNESREPCAGIAPHVECIATAYTVCYCQTCSPMIICL